MQKSPPTVGPGPFGNHSKPKKSAGVLTFPFFRRAVIPFECWTWLIILGLLIWPNYTRAIMLFETGDPVANTSAPTGELAKSGWQHQGLWGNFTGTPIAPQFFVTARHVGGEVGQVFKFRGADYITTAYYDDLKSDLRIWRIGSAFPSYAPLFDGSDEVGRRFVVIGRGTQRGAEIWSEPSSIRVVSGRTGHSITPTGKIVLCGNARDRLAQTQRSISAITPVASTTGPPAGLSLRGWENGPADGVQRWGENQFAGVLKFGGSLGELLSATFDAEGGPNEATFSVGDSGGAAFVNVDGVWKLAGINYGVSGPYKRTANGPAIYGAIFNESGLFKGSRLVPDRPQAVPGSLYVTRISARTGWIYSVINPR